MIRYFKSEVLKQKRSFMEKILCIAPIVPIVLSLILMGGRYLLAGAYNWWYTMILPGTIALLVAFSCAAEKKHNCHGLFAVCVKKEKLWISKIMVHGSYLLLLNLFFAIILSVVGLFFGIEMPYKSILLAGLVLTITNMWQIPLLMWLSEITGSIVTIVLSFVCNMGFGILFAPTKLWYLPFAIPARLMCSIIQVLPNGIPVGNSNSLCNSFVIMPGIAITVLLFVIISGLTSLCFRSREVNK